MSSSPTPPGFYQLSQDDQKRKMRKKQQIESHWDSSIDEVIPKAIRPRYVGGTRSTAKAKIGQQAPEAEWWRWAVEFYYRLENLASMTPGRLAFAQALMQAEVSEPQKDYTATHRETAEITKTDLVKIIEELRQRQATGQDDSSGSDEDDDEVGDEEAEGLDDKLQLEEDDAVVNTSTMSASDSVRKTSTIDDVLPPIKTEPETDASLKRQLSQDEPLHAKRHHATSKASKETLETKANIASLRAAAARLRHQASQREAKAYKLEAEMWEREAGEVE